MELITLHDGQKSNSHFELIKISNAQIVLNPQIDVEQFNRDILTLIQNCKLVKIKKINSYQGKRILWFTS